MKKLAIFSIFLFFTIGTVVSVLANSLQSQAKEDIIFRFQKSLFPNKYHLLIINRSKRTVEFHNTIDNYYIISKNGTNISITDMSAFEGIGRKGRRWAVPGSKIVISFKIDKSIIKNAKEIVFKGISYIPRVEGSFLHQDDTREIIVTYNTDNQEILMTVSDKVISLPNFGPIFGDEANGEADKDHLERKIDYNQFRVQKEH